VVASAALFVGSPIMRYGQRSSQEAVTNSTRTISPSLTDAIPRIQREQAFSAQAADLCNSAHLYVRSVESCMRLVNLISLHSMSIVQEQKLRHDTAGNHVRTGKARAWTGMASRS
jgi:hypothetical protein